MSPFFWSVPAAGLSKTRGDTVCDSGGKFDGARKIVVTISHNLPHLPLTSTI